MFSERFGKFNVPESQAMEIFMSRRTIKMAPEQDQGKMYPIQYTVDHYLTSIKDKDEHRR